MQILYLGSFRLPNLDAAAARVINVAKSLREAGHNVNFISWGGEQRDSDLCADGKYRFDGFEYIVTHELDSQGGFLERAIAKWRRGNKTKRILLSTPNAYDAIITYNGCLTSWLLNFSKKHHIKLINDITEWYSFGELKCTDWLPYTINMCCTQKRVKNKIVISSFLDKFYNKTHNIVVPATCDSSDAKWHQDISYVKQKVGHFDGITLIYAGNPSRKDLVHTVINVLQRLIEEGANIRFLILGITREKYIKNYADLLRTTGLSDKILFLGRVSQDLIPAFYSISDFMVLLREPNRKSNAGFPTKFAESFTSGTPVIANLTSDLGKYLIDGKTGFVANDYTEECLYDLLINKIIPLSSKQLAELKYNVQNSNAVFDYHYYIESLKTFSNELV